MNDKVFRKKSIERVSSPDEIDTYIKAASPQTWVLLSAIIIFLVGVLIWGCVGKLETRSTVGCTVINGVAEAVISEEDFARLTPDAVIRIDGVESEPFNSVSEPLDDQSLASSYIFHVSEIEEGEWFYFVTARIPGVENGQYRADFVMEKISPIKFIIN